MFRDIVETATRENNNLIKKNMSTENTGNPPVGAPPEVGTGSDYLSSSDACGCDALKDESCSTCQDLSSSSASSDTHKYQCDQPVGCICHICKIIDIDAHYGN